MRKSHALAALGIFATSLLAAQPAMAADTQGPPPAASAAGGGITPQIQQCGRFDNVKTTSEPGNYYKLTGTVTYRNCSSSSVYKRVDVAVGDDSKCLRIAANGVGSYSISSYGFLPYQVPYVAGMADC